ncbi:MAG: peptide ABC transporter substrate-binding protein [Dehalococcoidales bacterium]|nr:MAG: peptide ABC transporter substrate-binding protein [Dehalococcoidales bacterium]
MRRATYFLISVTLLLGLLLTGCPPEPPPVLGQGSLSLYGIDPMTLDPAISGEMTSHEYITQIFSGLVRLGDDLEPEPDIAEKWTVSSDGMTYRFYLRRGVTFHDGREVKAEDFVYSWERACNPETGSQTAAAFLGDIVGAKAVLAGETQEISGIRALNDYTLEVTIDVPRSYFLYKLTYPTTFVVDRVNVESGEDWWHNPNGTGPFKLQEWNQYQLLTLERNESFYGTVAGVESVVYHLWAGIPMNLYETGEIDVTGVSLPYIDRVTDETGPFYSELLVVPRMSFIYIGFNADEPPFDDVNVRRAFTQALDKAKLVRLVYRDMMEPADGILPPGILGYNEALSGLDFDVEEALASIRASRYGSVSALPPITITTMGWGGSIGSDLEAIVHEWRQNLGVEVKVRQLEPEFFLYNLKEEKDEMYYLGWIADYPHPQDFLDILFQSEAKQNYGEYSNPEVDALLAAAGTELDMDRSLELYQQIEQILVDDAACLPLWFEENYVLVKPHVNGYVMNVLGLANLNLVSVEDE